MARVDIYNIPKDLEILQVYARDKRQLDELLSKLSLDDLMNLLIMLESLYMLLESRLSRHEVSKELPVADDHFFDFCYYCLSLPRDRIRSLLEDPCRELLENRIYYVELNGIHTYADEGYLISHVSEYMRRVIGFRIRPSRGETSEEHLIDRLRSYKDVLSRIHIPYDQELSFSCL